MINFFIDMDGVTCAYSKEEVEFSEYYKEGFFLNLKPHPGNLKMLKMLIDDFPNANFYILSSLLAESEFIEKEKNQWLDAYLPEIKKENRLFVPEGFPKSEFIKEKVKLSKEDVNILLDDYTVNLKKWKDDGFLGIKVINNINNTKGEWLSENPENFINYRAGSQSNKEKIKSIILKENS